MSSTVERIPGLARFTGWWHSPSRRTLGPDIELATGLLGAGRREAILSAPWIYAYVRERVW